MSFVGNMLIIDLYFSGIIYSKRRTFMDSSGHKTDKHHPTIFISILTGYGSGLAPRSTYGPINDPITFPLLFCYYAFGYHHISLNRGYLSN